MASKLKWGAACAGLGAAALVTACFGSGSGDEEQAPQEVVAQRPSMLGAVVILEGGCTAVRVGPKHLLVGARCVTNRPQYAIGKPIRFRKANVSLGDARPTSAEGGASDAASEAAPPAVQLDASSDAASTNDGGTTSDASGPIATTTSDGGDAAATTSDVYEETIAKIEIHPSFLQKCGTGTCTFGKVGAADVADVALLVLGREPVDLATAPVDLDPVSINDRVLVLSNGCDAASLSAAPGAPSKLRAKETKSVAVETVLHESSPFQDSPQSLSPLAKSYVVTRGPGNADAVDALGVCSEKDLGAPLFRFDGSSVVGLNSNVTMGPAAAGAGASRLPITNHHSRVDGLSKHQIGAWLGQAGVKTTSSCTGSDGGCPPPPDGGESAVIPDNDAAPTDPTGNPGGEELPPGTGELPNGATPDNDDPAPKVGPKQKVDNAGCSASPTASTSSNGSMFGFLAVVAGVLAARLRRRR